MAATSSKAALHDRLSPLLALDLLALIQGMRYLLMSLTVFGSSCLTMRVAFELVYRWEVVWKWVAGLAALIMVMCEPTVATEFARGAITTHLGSEVSCEVLQLVLREFAAASRGRTRALAASTTNGFMPTVRIARVLALSTMHLGVIVRPHLDVGVRVCQRSCNELGQH